MPKYGLDLFQSNYYLVNQDSSPASISNVISWKYHYAESKIVI